MHAYPRIALLMFALGLACAALAAGKGGSAHSAASTSASSPAASSGALGTGRTATGSSSAPAHGGSASRSGGMHGNYRPAPELDAKRKISEQDCTKPIVHDAGNLRCK